MNPAADEKVKFRHTLQFFTIVENIDDILYRNDICFHNLHNFDVIFLDMIKPDLSDGLTGIVTEDGFILPVTYDNQDKGCAAFKSILFTDSSQLFFNLFGWQSGQYLNSESQFTEYMFETQCLDWQTQRPAFENSITIQLIGTLLFLHIVNDKAQTPRVNGQVVASGVVRGAVPFQYFDLGTTAQFSYSRWGVVNSEFVGHTLLIAFLQYFNEFITSGPIPGHLKQYKHLFLIIFLQILFKLNVYIKT